MAGGGAGGGPRTGKGGLSGSLEVGAPATVGMTRGGRERECDSK